MLLLTGTYALFGLINKPGTIPFSSPTVEGGLHVLYPELSFVFLAWLMFLLITHLRLTLLIGLVGGQALLAWPFSTVHFQHYSYPVYVLITVNCFYLLILYFYFSSDRWGSGSLKDATDVYKRNDS
jgi:hypothetical protein